jgi:hypothetical protein
VHESPPYEQRGRQIMVIMSPANILAVAPMCVTGK